MNERQIHRSYEASFTTATAVSPKKVTHIYSERSRVSPWMRQSFLTFDSVDRILKCDHSLKSCRAVLYCGAVC